jgi:nicotinamide mononucleotide adenylyltransferase
MTKKIVRIQKLNDIDQDDWKITFDDEVYITKTHEQFFELVEIGLNVATSREIKMSERPKAEETSAIFETDKEVKRNEKKKVNEFREDVRNLSFSQFNKKYTSRNLGDTKK